MRNTDDATRSALAVLLAATVAIGCGEESPAKQPKRTPSNPNGLEVDRFNAARAFSDLKAQVAVGERPAGSRALRALAERLRRKLPRGRFEDVAGHPGLRNIIGRVPGARPAVVVAAHYDSKDIPGFVGAEDSAGGTAAVIELARYFRRARRPATAPELRFVLFDGEECPDDRRDFYTCGLRGSRDYADRHAAELRAVVVLDFIAQKDLAIPRDDSSDLGMWTRLRAAARRVGALRVFPDAASPTVLDDHTPFLRAGIPAIDLIDFDFPCWHKTCDDLSAVSARSLDLSGEAVLEMLRAWRR